MERGAHVRQNRHLHAQTRGGVGDNGRNATHQSVWKDGKNLFADNGYAGLSDFALYYIGGIIKHARALTNPPPTVTSAWSRAF